MTKVATPSVFYVAAVVAVLTGGITKAAQTGDAPETVPPVVLSKQHAALCKVGVGDAMPAIELPRVNENETVRLSELFGENATVVVFWSSDRRMALAELADLPVDVVEPFRDQGVAVVGIAVNESASSTQDALQQANADFPNLLDAEGQAFQAVGRERLPRTYVLDREGKIVWFDIEYSHATRRELQRALRALTEM